MARRILTVLAMPLVIVVAVPLAALAALGFYLLAIVHGVWLLCRAVSQWLRRAKDKTESGQLHSLAARAPTHLGD
jgi:hypothetical protein